MEVDSSCAMSDITHVSGSSFGIDSDETNCIIEEQEQNEAAEQLPEFTVTFKCIGAQHDPPCSNCSREGH